MEGKKASASLTEQVQILSYEYMNGYKRLFGGKLMEWIDIVAAVAARRHSGKNVTTASVDNLQFSAPAYVNNTVVLIGKITYTGRTSMEVCVKTYVEDLDGSQKIINTAYVVMVALDENDRPTPIPTLIVETEEEKEEWERALKRNELRKQRRRENY